MLQQARMSRGNLRIEQLTPDSQGKLDESRIRIDVNRLAVARYVILGMGALLLLSLVVQALFLDGGVGYSRVFKIVLVALLGPGLVFVASDKEMKLLQALDKRGRQLDQRIRENKALNRMTQAHLADCMTDRQHFHRDPQPQALPQLQQEPAEIFTEAEPAHLRPDYENVIVLDPEDDNYDRRFFEAAGVGSR